MTNRRGDWVITYDVNPCRWPLSLIPSNHFVLKNISFLLLPSHFLANYMVNTVRAGTGSSMSHITRLTGSIGANEHKGVIQGHRRGRNHRGALLESVQGSVYKGYWVGVDGP